MGFRMIMRLVALPLLTIFCLATFASADQDRPGRLVTLDNKEIVFDSIMERDIVKGWWNGSAINVPLDTVTEVMLPSASKEPKPSIQISERSQTNIDTSPGQVATGTELTPNVTLKVDSQNSPRSSSQRIVTVTTPAPVGV